MFLGKTAHKDDDYLRNEGPEHVMAFNPPRTGKGAGLVVTTLLSWPGSAVIHGINGQNRHLTAGILIAVLALPAVQPNRREVGSVQPAARSAARHA